MIEAFLSRPNWAPPAIEHQLGAFYQLLQDAGFHANTIGKSQAPLRSPFEDVRRLMKKCRCSIILGLPQIFIRAGSLKHDELAAPVSLATEWNQIEATMSLMLDLPTLVLLHQSVRPVAYSTVVRPMSSCTSSIPRDPTGRIRSALR